jgi:hypothetical protein
MACARERRALEDRGNIGGQQCRVPEGSTLLAASTVTMNATTNGGRAAPRSCRFVRFAGALPSRREEGARAPSSPESRSGADGFDGLGTPIDFFHTRADPAPRAEAYRPTPLGLGCDSGLRLIVALIALFALPDLLARGLVIHLAPRSLEAHVG